MNKTNCMIIVGILFIILTGCSPDSRELDDRSLIVGLSIDLTDEGNYSVSIQLPMVSGKEESGPLNKQFEVFNAEGESLWDAFAELESKTPTVLFFGHLKIAALSEDVAKDGLRTVIDFLDRKPTIANRVQLLVIKRQDAEEFIKQESPLVQLPALYMDHFFKADQKLARSHNVRLFEYRRDSNTVSKAALLPMATSEEKTIIVKDMAIFKEHKMIAELIGGEVGISTLLREDNIKSMNKSTTIELDNGVKAKVGIKDINLSNNMSYKKTHPIEINFKIKGRGDLVEMSKGRSTTKEIKKIEEKISADIETEIEQTLTKLQELNVDPLLISQRIWAWNTAYFESLDWEESGWKEAKFTIHVDFKIENTGQRSRIGKHILGH